MASSLHPGPLCRHRVFPGIDDGTLCLQASPTPGPLDGLSLWPELYTPGFLPAALGLDEAITASDKEEFKVIKKMPVLDSRHRAYHSVNSYVAHRTRYFGAPSVYRLFAAESDAELANTVWQRKKHTLTLRSMIEFSRPHEAEKQKVFYRWVRKAYKLRYGDDADVPEIIRKGMSEELAKKIADVRGSIRVKAIHDERFHSGGFNPRPIKYSKHYLLGTLSEHASGMAVDIDDKANAQLTLDEWTFIEDLAGKKVVRSGRWASEASAEALWQDIKEVNDLFVEKVAAEIKRIDKERAEKAKADKEKAEKAQKASPKHPMHPPSKPARTMTPLEEILGKHFKSLSPWTKTGFFHLPLELVLELQAHDFTWGATFSSNVDLHHFELAE